MARYVEIGKNSDVHIAQFPHICPICHVHIEPVLVDTPPIVSADNNAYILLRCTNRRCLKPFFAYYKHLTYGDTGDRGNYGNLFDYVDALPSVPVTEQALKNVATVSPKFYPIYNQAQHAEHYGLTEIAGPGYRKALEFLVKDYVTREARESKSAAEAANDAAAVAVAEAKIETVRKMLLANVIANKITDDDIKQMATRAAWLGNDETHYTRIWAGQDLQVLKHLLALVVGFVDRKEQARKYMAAMQKP